MFKKKILAVEHNAKLAVPNWFSSFPIQRLKGYTKNKNKQAEEIANKYGTPVIANDDSDAITHMGAAYTEFPKHKIRISNKGEEIVQDIITLIANHDFKAHKGYINFSQWVYYAGWNLTFMEKILKSRKRYEKKHQK